MSPTLAAASKNEDGGPRASGDEPPYTECLNWRKSVPRASGDEPP